MTQIIFNNWLIDFDREKKKKRKIFLLINNCTPRNEPSKLVNIGVEYFPPNCTAVLQPLDQGIITLQNFFVTSNCMRFGEKYPKEMQCEGSYRMDMRSLG